MSLASHRTPRRNSPVDLREPSDGDAWLGLDLGTQGVRALVADAGGQVLGRGTAPLTGHRSDKRHEQHAEDWWAGTCTAARAALGELPPGALAGVAVCGTSGTV